MDIIDRKSWRDSALLFLALVSCLLLNYRGVDAKVVSPADLQIKRYLEKINKPAVKTIKSSSTELIDCVDIYKQPAFDHPLLLNHTVQMEPSLKASNKITHKVDSSTKILQGWHVKGKCPQGTVPIRRVRKADILRGASVESFGKKHPSFHVSRENEEPATVFYGHEHSVVTQSGDLYYGANADINLWRPRVRPNDFSLSQIWIISDESIQNTVEVGIMVFPRLYGDYKSRLFVYWTADDYESTGCYNLMCPGFVQVSSSVALGTAFSPTSTYKGVQYVITIYIIKDPESGNWWLSVGGHWVGYWPDSLLPDLQNGARYVEWGGEVYNDDYRHGSTTTEMGSGHFAQEGFKKAAFFDNLKTADVNGKFHYPTSLQTIVEKPKCYNLVAGGKYFYYGGPGKSAACP